MKSEDWLLVLECIHIKVVHFQLIFKGNIMVHCTQRCETKRKELNKSTDLYQSVRVIT